MSAIRIPISITTEPAIPIPVAPTIPDDSYAAAFPGSPLKRRPNAKPKPATAPSKGTFLAVALAIAFVINFEEISLIYTFRTP